MPKKLEPNIVLEMCKQAHPEQNYLYDLSTFTNTYTKFKITCPIHGEFWQTPANHIHSKTKCPKCVNNNFVSNTQEFIQKVKSNIPNNIYNYSKVNYIDNHTKVCIICPKHGEFWQSPNNHLSKKQGCPECKSEKLHKHFQKDPNVFIQQATQKHNNFYDYSKVEYQSSHIKVCIICPKHGEFWQTPASHLDGKGCPKCKMSKGERQVEQWLIQNNIEFITQKRFKECRNKYPLPFDFYLPQTNTCIEYDGELHFQKLRLENQKKAKQKLQQTQIHDKIKTKYCQDNQISLIRINFKDNILQVLQESTSQLL